MALCNLSFYGDSIAKVSRECVNAWQSPRMQSAGPIA